MQLCPTSEGDSVSSKRTLLDSSGLVPESPEWIAYWMGKIETLGTADYTRELIPFAAARYHLMNGPDFTWDRTDRGP